MAVLQIRLSSEELKVDLAREAEARGMTSSAMARQLLVRGVDALRRERERAEWIAAAEPAIVRQKDWFENRGHPFAGIMPLDGGTS